MFCGLLAVTVTSGCERFPYPAPWPHPAGWEEVRRDAFNQSWRSASPNRFVRVAADFNGDHVEDKVLLMFNRSSGRVGLWVALTVGDRATNDHLLDEIPDVTEGSTMGIALVTPGKYKTACGKGYWDCDSTEAPEITVEHAAIRYFKQEGAESFWVWDADRRSMKRVWISD